MANAEGRPAAVASPAHRRKVLMGGAAVGRGLRWRTVAGVASGYLVRGDRCNETNAETFSWVKWYAVADADGTGCWRKRKLPAWPGSLHAPCSDLAIGSAAKSELGVASSVLARCGCVGY